jgi:predicted transcriptional regulator
MADKSGQYTSIDGQRLGPNQSLAWPRHAPNAQPAQRQPEPPLANDLLAQMSKRAIKSVNEKYAPGFQQIQTALNYEIQNVTKQFDIKQQDMYRLFTSESDPDRKKAIESRMLTAKNAAQAKISALQNKQQPAIDELNAAMRQEIQGVQRKATEKDIALQTIKGLVQDGRMDAVQAKKAEYKMVGINWEPPKSQVATLEQEKTAIEDDLRDVTKLLTGYDYKPGAGMQTFGITPYGKFTDPITGKKRKATKEEAAQFKQLEERKRQLTKDYQNLLMQSDPRFRTTIERDRRNREASKALTGGARPNLETAIRSTIGKETRLPVRQMIKKLRTQGLDREEIRAQLIGMGYK